MSSSQYFGNCDFFSRVELSKGGMGLDPNDATMGPIMDSLIMTSKKRYVSNLILFKYYFAQLFLYLDTFFRCR